MGTGNGYYGNHQRPVEQYSTVRAVVVWNLLLLNLRLAHAGTYTHLSRRPHTRVGPKRDPRGRPTHRGSNNRSRQTRAAPDRRTADATLTPRRPTTRPTSRPPLDAPRASPTRAARGQTPAHGSANASTARQGPKSRPAAQEAFQGQSRAKLGLHSPCVRLESLPGQPWLHREDAGCGARRTLQRVRRVARIATAHAVDA